MTTFLRKIVNRMQTGKNNSSESVDGDEEMPMLTNEDGSPRKDDGWTGGQTDGLRDNSRSAASLRSSREDNKPSLSASSLDRTLRKKTKTLNNGLDKYRRERWAVEQKTAQVQHLQEEISALMGMLTHLKKQKSLMAMEKNNKLREMALTCKLVTEDISPELRKKEPLQFKKYNSAKTMADVHSLLQSIHLKQKALEHLEVLAFKKLLVFEHKGLSTLAKNNNNTSEQANVQILIEDALEGIETTSRENATSQTFNRPRFLFNSMEIINSFGFVPASFDNPVFESVI